MDKNQELNLVLSDMNGTDDLRRYIMEYAELSPDEQIEIERILDDAFLKLTGDLIKLKFQDK